MNTTGATLLLGSLIWTLGSGCVGSSTASAQAAAAPTTDLSKLSDEFDDPKSAGKWEQVTKTERSGAEPLERFEVNRPAGWLTIVPRTSVWYRDFKGALSYKNVEGDFVVTTSLRVSNRSGSGAPRSLFSLAGLMVRTPRSGAWRPGGENYCFLSLGSGDRPGQYQLEVKSTVNSDSQLQLTPANGGEARIRVARVGSTLLMLVNFGQGWRVHRRYSRPDMPATLQVGLTTYTDWSTCEQYGPERHNATTITNGRPDLVAQFDYVRFVKPNIPVDLRAGRWQDSGGISDARVLALLGN